MPDEFAVKCSFLSGAIEDGRVARLSVPYICAAEASWRRLFMQTMAWPDSRDFFKDGRRMASRSEMMAITTKSSTRVNAVSERVGEEWAVGRMRILA